MSDVEIMLLFGFILATCAQSHEHRLLGYVIAIVCLVIIVTLQIAKLVFRIGD